MSASVLCNRESWGAISVWQGKEVLTNSQGGKKSVNIVSLCLILECNIATLWSWLFTTILGRSVLRIATSWSFETIGESCSQTHKKKRRRNGNKTIGESCSQTLKAQQRLLQNPFDFFLFSFFFWSSRLKPCSKSPATAPLKSKAVRVWCTRFAPPSPPPPDPHDLRLPPCLTLTLSVSCVWERACAAPFCGILCMFFFCGVQYTCQTVFFLVNFVLFCACGNASHDLCSHLPVLLGLVSPYTRSLSPLYWVSFDTDAYKFLRAEAVLTFFFLGLFHFLQQSMRSGYDSGRSSARSSIDSVGSWKR